MSSPVDGELARVVIDLYQTVLAGQPLATMDGAGLDARIETARAELERLVATMESERATITAQVAADQHAAVARYELSSSMASLEYPAELRAFHEDEVGLELKILETRLGITTSQLDADRVEVALRRLQALPAELVSQAAPEDMERRLAVQRAHTEGLQLIEVELEARLEQARERRRALTDSYGRPPFEVFPDSALEARLAGWRAAIVVQQKRMDELDLLRSTYVLRAPTSGRVAALLASEGQFLLAGDPVLILMDANATDVSLWVPESAPSAPDIGDRFFVTRRVDAQADEVAECVVQLASPRLEVMPQRLWRDAQIAEYGRAFLIGPVSTLSLVPGERVRIDPTGG